MTLLGSFVEKSIKCSQTFLHKTTFCTHTRIYKYLLPRSERTLSFKKYFEATWQLFRFITTLHLSNSNHTMLIPPPENANVLLLQNVEPLLFK